MKTAMLSIDALREAVARLPDDRLAPMRRVAVDKLGEQGLPTLRDEDWKYTDLSSVIEVGNASLLRPEAKGAADVDKTVRDVKQNIEADWVVIANGEVDVRDIDGVGITRLSESEVALESDVALTQLNTALLRDGVRIHLEDDAVRERPVGILIVDDSTAGSVMSQARVEIELGDNSQASFVEYHASRGAEKHYSNSVINLQLGRGARADFVRIQDRDQAHAQTGRMNVRTAKDSEFRYCGFDFGGQFVRNDLSVSIEEPGVSATFDGLYLAGADQHIDNHTRVDHRVGPAESRQEYRGILTGDARCIWNGKAIVHAGADGTDAAQANHNLLLSERAEVDAKPELEIYADDVKCTHGATVGQLDEDALFYLRTRGLDKALAQQVLTRAFAQAIVSHCPVNSVRDHLTGMIEARLFALLEATEQ